MYCYQCGSENPDVATSCSNCGAVIGKPHQATFQPGPRPQLNNYLVPAIIASVFCCQPFGIVSVVYAAQVNAMLDGGNIAGATEAARNAKMWFWISFGLGVLPFLAYLGMMIIVGIFTVLDGAAR
jgi:hypothetical protein